MVFGGLVVLGGLVVFTFGETLFGSSRGTIDSYNREVLDTCSVPSGSTLVRTFGLGLSDGSGQQAQSMSYVYASPLDADELAAVYGVPRPGIHAPASPEWGRKFQNRPSTLILSLWSPGHTALLDNTTETAGLPADPGDEFWAGDGADITDVAEVPDDTRSFLRLRLAQRYVEGVFGS